MNREDVLQLLRTRYTTKHYDASRPVSDEDLAVLLEALRLSPTSVNGQYTKFFVAKTPEARARLMPAVMDFNQERVKNASHLIVFAVPKTPTEEHLRAVLEQETADGRFPADMPKRCATRVAAASPTATTARPRRFARGRRRRPTSRSAFSSTRPR